MANPRFKVKEEKITQNRSEFVLEPLEPGYGHTLGNALRRTLLTTIPGAAVTSAKISGVKHKFSTIPGVKENIVDLLLNIKGLNFRLLDGENKAKVTLFSKGQKEITGKDFDLPDNVEIENLDHHVASINDKKAKLEMELTIEQGLGYSSSEERRTTALGVIPTDAVFTPVRRVGRQTDLDKLILNVWTNGIVSPKEALEEAAKILTSYFLQIYEPKSQESSEDQSTKPSPLDSLSKLTIDELDLPTRIYNSLRNGGIETLGQLLATTKKELISMRNMGNKSIMTIEEKLKEKGAMLAQ